MEVTYSVTVQTEQQWLEQLLHCCEHVEQAGRSHREQARLTPDALWHTPQTAVVTTLPEKEKKREKKKQCFY